MLQRFIARPGRIDMEDERARLFLPAVPNSAHIFSQLNDYQANKTFTHAPPFSATLNANASASTMLGSFGFGLWNESVTETGETLPASDGFIFLYSRSSESETPIWQAAAWQADGRAQHAELSDIAIANQHRYQLSWQADAIRFEVDGVERLQVAQPFNSPLGFVVWMSNRTLRLTPEGKLAGELVAIPEAQWLEVKALRLK